MVDFILVTGISKFVKNAISSYVDEFLALFRQFISKNAPLEISIIEIELLASSVAAKPPSTFHVKFTENQ